MKKKKCLAVFLFLFVFFLPCTAVLAEETISDVLTGWVNSVDGEKIVINDTSLKFSAHVEYLDQDGQTVTKLSFGSHDKVLYRVNIVGEIVSIQKGGKSLPKSDPEVIEKNPGSAIEQSNKKLKIVDGVWTN